MGKVLLEEQSLIDIANSIRNKTKSTETMKPSEMATNIDSIEASGGTDLSEYFTETITGGSYAIPYIFKKIPPLTNTGTSCSSMFANCINVTDIDLSKFNTNDVTNMYQMFYNCKNLTSLDVSKFNTENVTNMSQMFQNAENLTSLDLSNFNVSNVKNMSYMFGGMIKITRLDLSNFITTSLTNVTNMFTVCKALTHLDIRNFDFTNVTSYSSMFGNSAANWVPEDCLIIVKDETAKSWITTNFSRMTNVKTVAEYESGV